MDSNVVQDWYVIEAGEPLERLQNIVRKVKEFHFVTRHLAGMVGAVTGYSNKSHEFGSGKALELNGFIFHGIEPMGWRKIPTEGLKQREIAAQPKRGGNREDLILAMAETAVPAAEFDALYELFGFYSHLAIGNGLYFANVGKKADKMVVLIPRSRGHRMFPAPFGSRYLTPLQVEFLLQDHKALEVAK